MKKIKIKFGTVLIDKLHQFFGVSDPRACIVSSAWENEDSDGNDCEVWVDHYRGHIKFSYSDIRDTNRFEVTNYVIDCNKNVLNQLKKIEKEYQKKKSV